MQVLVYNELNPGKISGFRKWQKLIERDDFKSADVKKIGDNLYRARLNRNDRLLFSIYRYQEQPYVLVLEYLKNHDYTGSRFLHGKQTIADDKLPDFDPAQTTSSPQLPYVNREHPKFNILDKIIAFDPVQQDIYGLTPPLIIIGSAGSGKTALTLEKMKAVPGEILYVTLSPYLVKNARDLYFANGYENEEQQIDFLSFQEFLESIKVPQGKPVDFPVFAHWFSRQRQSKIKDAHKLFEEFRGVLTGPAIETAWLSREAYLGLGVKQSIFLEQERPEVYDIFTRYQQFLKDEKRYDTNIISHQYLSLSEPRYDFVVVDEVQDLTNIQLFLILQSLRQPTEFLLCGDSNQIVHPNFFSWSKVKTLFHQQAQWDRDVELIRILQTNYRNSPHVTELSNRILRLKQARFGSIDKESNYLVTSNGHVSGNVLYLQDRDNIRHELNSKTRTSTRFAVVVMHAEQKAKAQQYFNTPLVFSIQEAKGLEYENIILYNFLTAEARRFREISQGVTPEDLQQGDLKYSRAKDKTDKSLEVFKFYINALYVALTRAVKNLYWIESENKQPILDLLGLHQALDKLDLENQGSSLEEWQREAHKLELQGKQEQADRIRSEILKQEKPNWTVYNEAALPTLYEQAIEQQQKKAKLLLFEYALVYQDSYYLAELNRVGFRPASQPQKGITMLEQKYFLPYKAKTPQALLGNLNKFGANFRNPFNQTPLMVAAWLGNAGLVELLAERQPDTELVDNNKHNALQIAFAQAVREDKYASKQLKQIYFLLRPDSMSIQIDGRLVKLGNHLMEFILLNLLIAAFYQLLPKKLVKGQGVTAGDILDIVTTFPTAVLPERRKKRPYISSILSKNEVQREGPYNRKLFKRIRTGHYVFNPGLALKVEGEWVNIYDICQFTRLRYHPEHVPHWWDTQHADYYDGYLKRNISVIEQQFKQLEI